MRTYRISFAFLATNYGFGTVAALLYAAFLGHANPLATFLTVELIFLIVAILAWSFRSIRLESEHISSTFFFLLTTKYPIKDVKKVTFVRYGITEDYSIEFYRHPTLHLTNFDEGAIYEITNYILKSRPDVEVPARAQ